MNNDIGWAVKQIKEDRKVTRSYWLNHRHAFDDYIYYNGYEIMRHDGYSKHVWNPMTSDLIATDYELCEDSAIKEVGDFSIKHLKELYDE